MSRLNCLSVKVERATGNPRSPFVKLFEKPLQIDENVSVPFETLTTALRFMYGDDVVVSFSSQILTLKNR